MCSYARVYTLLHIITKNSGDSLLWASERISTSRGCYVRQNQSLLFAIQSTKSGRDPFL